MEDFREISKINIGSLWNGEPAINLVIKFLRNVSKLTKVRAAIVIGSRARKDWNKESDIDLLLVLEHSIESKLPELRGFGVIDPKPYTEKTFIDGIYAADIEVIEAFENGKVLLDDGILHHAKDLYIRVRELLEIQRYKEGWKIGKRIPKEELIKILKEHPRIIS